MEQKKSSFLKALLNKKEVGILIPLVLIFVITGLVNPLFFGTQNIMNIIFQSSFVYIVAITMTFVLILAGMDLSVGSVMGLAGVVTGFSLLAGVPIFISIMAGILVGCLVGLFNGFMIAVAKLPGFIVTLSTMYMARGMCEFLTRGNPVYPLPFKFNLLGQGKVFIGSVGVQWTIIIAVILAIIAHIVLTRTTFGRAIFAIGGNKETARHSGINVVATTIIVYILNGACAALSGILTAARLGTALSNAGTNYEMNAIASVIIGGTSMFGGAGSILGTTIGALMMTTVTNAMAMLNISVYLQKVIIGAIILGSVAVDQFNRKKTGSRV